jgi:hypothetical protein
MVLDLSDVDFPAAVHHIDVNHGIGSAREWLAVLAGPQTGGWMLRNDEN